MRILIGWDDIQLFTITIWPSFIDFTDSKLDYFPKFRFNLTC